jgi:NOL1/NOP2/fmu family ribosome biogenesis protein
MDWVANQLSSTNCQLSISSDWSITETISENGNTGYRFWPDKVKGEGFFIACFRKTGEEDEASFKIKSKPDQLTKKESEIAQQWMKKDDHEFIKHLNTVYAWPKQLAEDFGFLLSQLRVIYSGTIIGELMRDKLVPDHALAMSNMMADSINRAELDYEQAIQYLQRKDLKIETENKGWQVVTYKGHTLGWINVLPNRINNYYPKELRILKDN